VVQIQNWTWWKKDGKHKRKLKAEISITIIRKYGKQLEDGSRECSLRVLRLKTE